MTTTPPNSQSMAKQGHRITRVWAFAGGLSLAIAAALTAGYFWLLSHAGNTWLLGQIETNIESAILGDVTISHVSGNPFSDLSVHGLRVERDGAPVLSAEKIAITWAPLALLRGELHVETIEVTALLVDGVLKSQPQKSEPAFWSPSSLRVDHLGVEGAAPFGQDGGGRYVHYILSASPIQISDKALFLSASLLSLDPEGDEIKAELDWTRASDELIADISLRGREHGIITRLAGVDQVGSIAFDLSGKGPLDAWLGRAVLDVTNAWNMDIGLTAQSFGKIDFEGYVKYPNPDNSLVEQTIGDSAKLQGMLELNDGYDLIISAGLSSVNGNSATIEGILPLASTSPLSEGLNLDAFVRRLTIPVADQSDLIMENLSLTGTLGDRPVAPVRTSTFAGMWDVGRVQHPAFQVLEASSSLNVTFSSGGIQSQSATTTGLVDIMLAPDKILSSDTSQFEIDAAYDRGSKAVRLILKHVQSDWMTGHGRALTDDGLVEFEIDFDAEVPLDTIGGLLNQPDLDGVLRAQLSLKRSDTSYGLLDIQGSVEGLSLGPSASKSFFPRAVDFQSSMSAVQPSTWDISQLVIDSEGIRLTAAGSITDEANLSLDYSLVFANPAQLFQNAPVAVENLTVNGALTGPFKGPSLLASANIDDVQIWGLTAKDAKLTATLRDVFAPAQGAVSLVAKTDLGFLSLESALSSEPERAIIFSNIEGSLSEISLTGEIGLTRAGQMSGILSGRVDNGTVNAPADVGISGIGEVNVRLSADDEGQHVDFDAGLEDVSISKRGGQRWDVAQIDANGALVFGATHRGGVDLLAQNIRRGALLVEEARVVALLGDGNSLEATLNGSYFDPFDLNVKMQGTPETVFPVNMDIVGNMGGLQVQSRKPVVLDMVQNGITASFPDIQTGTGKLAGIFSNQDGGRLSLAVTDVDAQVFSVLWPGGIKSGTLNGNIDYANQDSKEHLFVDFHARDFQTVMDFANANPPYSMNAKVQAQDGHFAASSLLTQNGSTTGQMTIDFENQQDSIFSIDETKPINLELIWDGAVDSLWQFARLYDHDLDGYLTGSLSVHGTVESPTFAGNAKLRDGSYQYLPTGLVLGDMAFELSGDQSHLTLDKFSANDGQEGTLSASGRFQISDDLVFPGTLEIKATNLGIFNLDSIEGIGSASLVYERGRDAASLSGQIEAERLSVDIDQRLPKSAIVLDVQEINMATTDVAPVSQIKAPASKRPPVNLDVSIVLPGHFFVRGRGLQSEWSGDLAARGTTISPRLFGTLKLTRGVFQFSGKQFNLSSGSLSFDGNDPIDPYINLVSRVQTSTLEAELIISGRLTSPQLSMSSTPALPEEEILAQLLFGSSIASLGPLQIAELASAVASLTGSGSGFNVVSTARDLVGLDSLIISSAPDDVSGTIIGGGKYLSDDLYLEFSTATATGEVITRILYDFSKRWRAESEMSLQKGSSLKLKWFWEY